MTETLTRWKEELDRATSCEAADSIVNQAIDEAPQGELVQFLGELYEEFTGPDPVGG